MPRIYNLFSIEVNEEGCKKASQNNEICSIQTLKFECNRPFIFLFHDINYKNILFLGKYVNKIEENDLTTG